MSEIKLAKILSYSSEDKVGLYLVFECNNLVLIFEIFLFDIRQTRRKICLTIAENGRVTKELTKLNITSL